MVRESYLTTMRYLNFLIPLVGLLSLGGLYTYRVYWAPTPVGHWHLEHASHTSVQLDIDASGNYTTTYGLEEPRPGGRFDYWARTMTYQAPCLGEQIATYQLLDVTNKRYKGVVSYPASNSVSLLVPATNCTQYSHWQLATPFPIQLPQLPPVHIHRNTESETLENYLYLSERSGELTYGLGHIKRRNLTPEDLEHWFEVHRKQSIETGRKYLTITLAADKYVSPINYQQAIDLLQHSAAALDIQLTIQGLHRSNGKLVAVQL